MMNKKIEAVITESVRIKEAVCKSQAGNIEKAASLITGALKSGGKLLVFGNGGSAADSQHIVAELVGRFKKERKALAAVALTTNTSILTAIANDYSYDATFSRQIEALGRKGDVALGLSTSGNSANVIGAMKKAKTLGLVTIALIGGEGGKLKGICDLEIIIPSKDTPRIQESQAMIGHVICELVEDEF